MRDFHSPHPCNGKLFPQNDHWTEQRARGIAKNRSVSRPWGVSPVSKEQKILPAEDWKFHCSHHTNLVPFVLLAIGCCGSERGQSLQGKCGSGGTSGGEGSPRMPESRWPLTTRTESRDGILAIREAESMFSLLPWGGCSGETTNMTSSPYSHHPSQFQPFSLSVIVDQAQSWRQCHPYTEQSLCPAF